MHATEGNGMIDLLWLFIQDVYGLTKRAKTEHKSRQPASERGRFYPGERENLQASFRRCMANDDVGEFPNWTGTRALGPLQISIFLWDSDSSS